MNCIPKIAPSKTNPNYYKFITQAFLSGGNFLTSQSVSIINFTDLYPFFKYLETNWNKKKKKSSRIQNSATLRGYLEYPQNWVGYLFILHFCCTSHDIDRINTYSIFKAFSQNLTYFSGKSIYSSLCNSITFGTSLIWLHMHSTF